MPGGKKHTKAKSKAQQRKFFALAEQGKMSEADAHAKAKKGKAFKKLPAHKKGKK